MCLIAFAFEKAANTPLVVISNRDEFYHRPTRTLHWWDDAPVLAGRDLQAGGTWIGLSKTGCFAAVTNYRRAPGGDETETWPRSRGQLVSGFLNSGQTASQWAESLHPTLTDYDGFNLLLFDGRELLYLNNYQQDEPQNLSPGVYALSNHLLDSPWPKVEYARQSLQQAIEENEQIRNEHMPRLMEGFSLQRQYPEHLLPDTGVSAEWERILSSPFITTPSYGTRASSVVIVSDGGELQMRERSFVAGRVIDDVEFGFEAVTSSDSPKAFEVRPEALKSDGS